MSWSVSVLGRPAAVVEHLRGEVKNLTGKSRDEYERALPHLVGLVEQTMVTHDGKVKGYAEPLVRVTASGSGSWDGDHLLSHSCTAKVEPEYTRLAT